MKIAVVGATGMIGSAVTDELLGRGHHVTGIAGNSDVLKVREALTRRSANLFDFDSFAETIRGHDAVICAFSPGHGMGAQDYKGVVEAGWRIKRAFKRAGGYYLINVGGASSLWTARGPACQLAGAGASPRRRGSSGPVHEPEPIARRCANCRWRATCRPAYRSPTWPLQLPTRPSAESSSMRIGVLRAIPQ